MAGNSKKDSGQPGTQKLVPYLLYKDVEKLSTGCRRHSDLSNSASDLLERKAQFSTPLCKSHRTVRL